MKIMRLLSLFFVLSLAGSLIPQETSAQRRKNKKVVIVHKRPGHRVVYRKAHIRYSTLPRWGAGVVVRPVNAVLIGGRGNKYYYHSGVYYTNRNNSYVVVRPYRGIRIRVLPAGFRIVPVATRKYYYYYGTYYVKSANDYVVVNTPKGAVVDALPDGYEIKTIDGNEYYYLYGDYYAEVDAPEFVDGVGYEVVDFK